MRFVYNQKQYEVMELHDIGDISWMGMVALFEIQYAYYKKRERVLVSEEDFLSQDDHPNSPYIFEERRFVNYFPQDSRDQQEIIDNCIYFIEHEYDEQFDELKYLLRKLKNAIVEFTNDVKKNHNPKSSLDRLEYAQSDLYDWVDKNISATNCCEDGDK